MPCMGPASRKRCGWDEEGREGGLARGLHAPEVSVVRTVSRGREGQEASESARGSRPSLPGRWGHLEAVGAALPAGDPDGLASPSVPLAPGLALSVPQRHCPPTGPAPCPHSVASAHRGPSAVGAEPSGPDLADEQDAAPAAGSQSPGRSCQPPSRRRPPVAKQARNATPAAAECALCVSPERLERSPVCRAERGAMPPPPLQPLFPPGPRGLAASATVRGASQHQGRPCPGPWCCCRGYQPPQSSSAARRDPHRWGAEPSGQRLSARVPHVENPMPREV